MKHAGYNNNGIICYLVNKPVFFIDSARPASFKPVFQWFRFANTFKRLLHGSFKKINNSVAYLPVIGSPFIILSRSCWRKSKGFLFKLVNVNLC